MSETAGIEKETSIPPNEESVKNEVEQQVDAAASPPPLLVTSGKEESKDTESEPTTPMETDNVQQADVAAQGDQSLSSVKQINSNSTPSTVDINTLTPSTPSQTPPQLLVADTSSTTTATTTASAVSAAAAAAIPDNILSPPKSETQTDETNTATSTSCSPASEGHRSPLGGGESEQQPPAASPPEQPKTPKQELEPEPEPDQASTAAINGVIPKSGGKPLVTALNKKINKSATSTSPRASRARKPKALPMYESEISDNKMGIKLCIKKSDAVAAAAELPIGASSASPGAPAARTPTAATSKAARKRVRKPKPPQDSDESEYEPRKKKGGGGTGSAGGGGGAGSNNGERQKKLSTSGTATEAEAEPVEQSAWGHKIPEEVLFRVREQRQIGTSIIPF